MLKFVAPAVTLCLLAGVAADKADRYRAPAGAEAYHARVLESLELIPYTLGDWVGTDEEIRQEALRILDANASLSRKYRELTTGSTATVLLVQCADARSLLGHYPPVCYPSQGWSQLSARPQTIPVGDSAIEAMEYQFEYDLFGQSNPLSVLHFTVLPDGRTGPDMQLLDAAAKERQFKFYGGASIQVVVSASLPDEERLRIWTSMCQAIGSWMAQVQAGASS